MYSAVIYGPGTNWSLVAGRLAPNMGDYISLTADGSSVYANWADGRLGSADSWVAAITGGREHSAELDGEPVAEGGAISGQALALRVANPARAAAPVAVTFDLPAAGRAALEVYSIAGERVRTLVAGELPAGAQRLTWDARDRNGRVVSPGMYFLVLESGARQVSRRIALLP